MSAAKPADTKKPTRDASDCDAKNKDKAGPQPFDFILRANVFIGGCAVQLVWTTPLPWESLTIRDLMTQFRENWAVVFDTIPLPKKLLLRSPTEHVIWVPTARLRNLIHNYEVVDAFIFDVVEYEEYTKNFKNQKGMDSTLKQN